MIEKMNGLDALAQTKDIHVTPTVPSTGCPSMERAAAHPLHPGEERLCCSYHCEKYQQGQRDF